MAHGHLMDDIEALIGLCTTAAEVSDAECLPETQVEPTHTQEQQQQRRQLSVETPAAAAALTGEMPRQRPSPIHRSVSVEEPGGKHLHGGGGSGHSSSPTETAMVVSESDLRTTRDTIDMLLRMNKVNMARASLVVPVAKTPAVTRAPPAPRLVVVAAGAPVPSALQPLPSAHMARTASCAGLSASTDGTAASVLLKKARISAPDAPQMRVNAPAPVAPSLHVINRDRAAAATFMLV